jgi:hypothetical protein
VIVSVEFEGPDEARQKRWVDTVLAALDGSTSHPGGGISGHFHVSLDGRRALNYAEWIDEESHRRAMEESDKETVGRGPRWRDVHEFKGIKTSGYRRYHLVSGVVCHK